MIQPIRRQQTSSSRSLRVSDFSFIHNWVPSDTDLQCHACHATDDRLTEPVPFVGEKRAFPSELFTTLGKQEIQNFLEVLHYAMEAETGDDVCRVLHLARRVVPCEKVIGGVVQLDRRGALQEFASVINVSYSNDWLYKYGTQGYAAVDPVLHSLLSSFTPQVWEQTYEGTASKKQKEFVEEARSYGLVNGITTGRLESQRGLASFFSFAGGDLPDAKRYTGLLEYLSPLLHRVLIRNVRTPLSNRIKGLSPRELTVLLWMKNGKTNWEISRIVGVSERTVRFHVERIFTKLDATSRTQAVATAIEQDLLAADRQ